MAFPFMAYTQARTSEEMDRTPPKFAFLKISTKQRKNIKLVQALSFLCIEKYFHFQKMRKIIDISKGTSIKDVRFFAIFGGTYLKVLPTYVLCTIYLLLLTTFNFPRHIYPPKKSGILYGRSLKI